ncbi:MAG: hypothetical protein COA75_08400 [Cellvibrionales bacterium]|nr:MAG: hypothetical protein COA75_08400 [Cellvibrionales bacterium]
MKRLLSVSFGLLIFIGVQAEEDHGVAMREKGEACWAKEWVDESESLDRKRCLIFCRRGGANKNPSDDMAEKCDAAFSAYMQVSELPNEPTPAQRQRRLPAGPPTELTGVNPEEAMKLKNIVIQGIDLTMTLGEIISTLESSGYVVECRAGSIECQVSDAEFTLKIQHQQKSASYRNRVTELNKDTLPLSIAYSVMDSAQACSVASDAMQDFCRAGATEFPCRRDPSGRSSAEIWSKQKSSDGYVYHGRFSIPSATSCAIRVGRKKGR